MIEFSEIIGHEDIIQHFKRSIEMGGIGCHGKRGSYRRLSGIGQFGKQPVDEQLFVKIAGRMLLYD